MKKTFIFLALIQEELAIRSSLCKRPEMDMDLTHILGIIKEVRMSESMYMIPKISRMENFPNRCQVQTTKQHSYSKPQTGVAYP